MDNSLPGTTPVGDAGARTPAAASDGALGVTEAQALSGGSPLPGDPAGDPAIDSPRPAAPTGVDESASAQLSSVASEAANGIREVGSTIKAESREKMSFARSQAEKLKAQAADRARQAAERGRTRVTSTLGAVALSARESAGKLEAQQNPEAARLALRAADTIDRAVTRVEQKDLDELVADVSEFVRRSPATAMAAATAIGFVLTRFLKASASSSTGYDADSEWRDPAGLPPTVPGGGLGDTDPVTPFPPA
jgi:ElaB/YqjD/DUF883 family membrane-anchored ribosome-binding protein